MRTIIEQLITSPSIPSIKLNKLITAVPKNIRNINLIISKFEANEKEHKLTKLIDINTWQKYLRFLGRDIRSSKNPTMPIIVEINIASESWSIPLIKEFMTFARNVKNMKNNPPDLGLFVQWEDLKLGLSIKISPILGIIFDIDKLVKKNMTINIDDKYKFICKYISRN